VRKRGCKRRRLSGLILLSALILISCTNSFWGYSEEVHTYFKAGPGYSVNDGIYYLVNYRLYRTPQGIMRFPDGGQSRILHRGTYLMTAADQSRPQMVMKLPAELDDAGVAGTHGFQDGLALVLEVRNLGETTPHTLLIEKNDSVYLPPAAAPGAVPEDMSPLEPVWDMTNTNNSLRRYSASKVGLPSPLEYCEKKPREYRKDIVRLNGDFPYRREVIEYLELRGEPASELLGEMNEYENGLTGLELDEYRLYAEETRAVLRGASDD
jgi:hypothetical protein